MTNCSQKENGSARTDANVEVMTLIRLWKLCALCFAALHRCPIS